jgi:hypothetical protein
MSTVYRGPSIDASYQVSVHLAEGFYTLCKRCTRWNDISCCGVLIFRCCFTCWRWRIRERRLVCIFVYLEPSKPNLLAT